MHDALVGKEHNAGGVHHRHDAAVLLVQGLFCLVVGPAVYGLAVAEAVHQEDDLFLLHRRLHIDGFRAVLQKSPSGHRIFLPDGLQVLQEELVQVCPAAQVLLIGLNVLQGGLMLLQEGVDLQTDQTVQAHLQNGLGLAFGEVKLHGVPEVLRVPELDLRDIAPDQAVLRVLHGLRAPQHGDYHVDAVAGLDQAFLDLALLLLFLEQDRVFSSGVLVLELQVVMQDALQVQRLRSPVGDGQHVDAKTVFKTCLLIKNVLYLLHVRVPLQFQDDAHAFLGGLVGDVGDLRQLLRFHQSRHVI